MSNGYGVYRKSGVGRIAAERVRQIVEKGWTPEHDRTEHADGSLVEAAYLLLADYATLPRPFVRHELAEELWEHASAKYRTDRQRLLEIAGALVAAELDRLDGGAS